jgi:hypothetical protein
LGSCRQPWCRYNSMKRLSNNSGEYHWWIHSTLGAWFYLFLSRTNQLYESTTTRTKIC